MYEVDKGKWVPYFMGIIVISLFLTIAPDVLAQRMSSNHNSFLSEYLADPISLFIYPLPFYPDNVSFTYDPFNTKAIINPDPAAFVGESTYDFQLSLLNNSSARYSYNLIFNPGNCYMNYMNPSCLGYRLPFSAMNFSIDMDSLMSDMASIEESETYAVYSALIDYLFGNAKILFIHNYTTPHLAFMNWTPVLESSNPLGKYLEGLNQETYQDYIHKNYSDSQDSIHEHYSDESGQEYLLIGQHYPLSNLFTIKGEYELVEGGIYNILEISRVGFNSEMDQALVYAGMMHAPLCGEGFHYFLVKEDGLWKVKDYHFFWVS